MSIAKPQINETKYRTWLAGACLNYFLPVIFAGVKQDSIARELAACYNFGVLGNRLVVGQRTLDPPGKVRILLPQPSFIRRIRLGV